MQTNSTFSLCQGRPSKNSVSSANSATIQGQVKQLLQKKLEENITSKASKGIEEIETEMNPSNVNMKLYDLSDDGCTARNRHTRGKYNMCAKIRESLAAVGRKLITCVCRHDLFNRKPQGQNITYHVLVNTIDQNTSCGKLKISNQNYTKVVLAQNSRGEKWAKETSTERTDMKTFKRSNLCENINFEPLPPKWTRLQLHQEHHEATQKNIYKALHAKK